MAASRRTKVLAILLASIGLGLSVGAQKTAPRRSAPNESEADRVVREAERNLRLEEERRERMLEHFGICDLDRNGWLSFREAAATFGIARAEFRRYDTDADGRIDTEEFLARGRTLLALLGALPTPSPPAPGKPAAPRSDPAAPRRKDPAPSISVADLLRYGDPDRSGGLDLAELKKLFTRLDVDLSAEVIAETMDPDDSGQLDAKELRPLVTLLARIGATPPPEPTSASDAPRGRNFERLYQEDTRVSEGTRRAGPPRIVGPVRHFRRLDLDNDGFIDLLDLRLLLRPARVEVRAEAILSALDHDGDGRLSEREFLASLTRSLRSRPFQAPAIR